MTHCADKANPIVFPRVEYPEAAIAFAIEPKSRADEDKISSALHKIFEEDPSLHFDRDAQTKEFIFRAAVSFISRRSSKNSPTDITSRSLFIRRKFLIKKRLPQPPKFKAVTKNSRADEDSLAIVK